MTYITRHIDRWDRWLYSLGASLVFVCSMACASIAQDRALIVAIDSYADERLSGMPASVAENDARSVERLLIEKLGYEKEDIKVLKNEQATRSEILAAIETWINPNGAQVVQRGKERAQLIGLDASGALDDKKSTKRKKRSARKKTVRPSRVYRSYIYFSGYGYFIPDADGDEKDGLDEALLPYDTKVSVKGDAAKIQNAILDDDVAAALEKVSRRHVTLVLDTSHSGVFTRTGKLVSKDIPRSRVPPLAGAVRSPLRPGVELHKDEGAFVDVNIPRGSLTVWSATSPTQAAFIAGPDGRPQGLFSLLYVEGLAEGMADSNNNGIISNAELLRHINRGSAAYCAAFRERCEMGLRPRLDPPQAYGRAAWVDRKKVSRAGERRLSLSRLMDFLGKQPNKSIEILQFPPSPVNLGEQDISYEVRSPKSAFLILLNLTQDGRLFQLYPNQFAGKDEEGFGGLLVANKPLSVPAKSSGIKFTATEPGKGNIIAIVTSDPVKFDKAITDRAIPAVSRMEAIKVYLARLSAALHYPTNTRSVQANTAMSSWSITTLPYEIVDRKPGDERPSN